MHTLIRIQDRRFFINKYTSFVFTSLLPPAIPFTCLARESGVSSGAWYDSSDDTLPSEVTLMGEPGLKGSSPPGQAIERDDRSGEPGVFGVMGPPPSRVDPRRLGGAMELRRLLRLPLR